MLDRLLTQAADQSHTLNERAAALSCAARLTGAPSPHWPDPPDGWRWAGGDLVRVAPSRLPPLRSRGVRAWPDPLVKEDADDQPIVALPPPIPPPRIKGARKPPAPDSGAGIVVELVLRPEGASLAELMQASGLSETSVKACVSIYVRGRVHHDRRVGRYLPVG